MIEIVINGFDVSNCGISLRGDLNSHLELKSFMLFSFLMDL